MFRISIVKLQQIETVFLYVKLKASLGEDPKHFRAHWLFANPFYWFLIKVSFFDHQELFQHMCVSHNATIFHAKHVLCLGVAEEMHQNVGHFQVKMILICVCTFWLLLIALFLYIRNEEKKKRKKKLSVCNYSNWNINIVNGQRLQTKFVWM